MTASTRPSTTPNSWKDTKENSHREHRKTKSNCKVKNTMKCVFRMYLFYNMFVPVNKSNTNCSLKWRIKKLNLFLLKQWKKYKHNHSYGYIFWRRISKNRTIYMRSFGLQLVIHDKCAVFWINLKGLIGNSWLWVCK